MLEVIDQVMPKNNPYQEYYSQIGTKPAKQFSAEIWSKTLENFDYYHNPDGVEVKTTNGRSMTIADFRKINQAALDDSTLKYFIKLIQELVNKLDNNDTTIKKILKMIDSGDIDLKEVKAPCLDFELSKKLINFMERSEIIKKEAKRYHGEYLEELVSRANKKSNKFSSMAFS